MKRTKIIEAAAIDIDGNGYYSVVAETARGARFILAGYGHRDADRVAALAARVQAAGSINADLWVDHWARYGSDAYEVEAGAAWEAATEIRAGRACEADFAGTSIATLL